MSDLFAHAFVPALEWLQSGNRVALATVTQTWGSAPRPVGSIMAVRGDGVFVGSVSGGCVEGAVIGEAQNALADGQIRNLEFGVSNETAWDVGLACGGTIAVHVAPVTSDEQRNILGAHWRGPRKHTARRCSPAIWKAAPGGFSIRTLPALTDGLADGRA